MFKVVKVVRDVWQKVRHCVRTWSLPGDLSVKYRFLLRFTPMF